MTTSITSTEIQIPVPWGHIAGKLWGNPSNSLPVLAVHGSFDNAATFDRLIPLLPKSFFYVSIDLPGHGLSSHIPPGFPYYFVDFLASLQRIVQYFKWNKVIMMGHSYGGFMSAFFAAMYPELVTQVVMFDIIGPKTTAPNWTVHTLRFLNKRIMESQKIEKSAVPQYSYESIIAKLKQGRATTLTDEGAKALLTRSAIKKGDKYSFCYDQRLKSALHPIVTIHHMIEIYSNIQCPVLIVFAEDSKPSLNLDDVQKTLNVLKYNSSNFKLTLVKGNHDVHLNDPAIVAPHVCKFLCTKTKCWRRSDGLPILGVHGLQDNAATFDRLAPLLPSSFYLVSIDLPGHGLSSHLPPGTLYHMTDMITVITRVAEYLKWDKFSYLGHSFGGQIGSYYASIYPERIDKLILLDVVRTRPLEADRFIAAFRSYHKKLLNTEKKISTDKMPCYSFEEAKRRVHASRYSELTDEALEVLLKRSLAPHNGGYVFRVDQRLKFAVFPPFTNEQLIAVLSNLRCSLLILKARDSLPIFELKGVQVVMDMYRKNCKDFEDLIVEGNHDVHMNYPERVATTISNFLLHNKSHL